MTTVSSKEFISKQKMYFDLALNEGILVKRGKNIFQITRINSDTKVKIKKSVVNHFFGAFQSDKSAEDMIDEIRKSRYFNREIETF